MTNQIFNLFISCPKNLEDLLAQELTQLGLEITAIKPQGVYGNASLNLIYKLCLWSRIAQRIQLILFTQENVSDQQSLHAATAIYPWHTVFTSDKTFAIEFHGSTPNIRNTMFGAQVIKDGMLDYFREFNQTRPQVDKQNPDLLFHAHLKNEILTVSLDLAGYSLHQRGYRLQAGEAPIKENLAAALLMRAKWPELSQKGASIYDPFCGSGTFIIEAAMIAANIAPGLLRNDQAFVNWIQHSETEWEEIRTQAHNQISAPKSLLFGSDIDAQAIMMSQHNAERAGVAQWINFTRHAIQDYKPNFALHNVDQALNPCEPGLVICNPPYGERLIQPLTKLYNSIGRVLSQNFNGWTAAVFTSDQELAKAIGLRSKKHYKLYNGALECQLYNFEIDETNKFKDATNASNINKNTQPITLTASATMFANRLKKNYTHLKKWAKRENIQCYRVYDADLPEYAYAIDLYKDYAVLQEYVAPSTIDATVAEQHRQEVVFLTPQILNILPKNIVHKQRKQQKGLQQYEKIHQTNQTIVVEEGPAKLQINLYDYLDTGLFLDHRLLRLKFGKLMPGTKFLNCFCYTASASTHAAKAGAITTNIDLSNTYLKWAQENFRLNNIDLRKHQFVQYDCIEWIKLTQDKFDVIFLDPPSFSNSKRMRNTLDIQRDHEELIDLAIKCLAPNGELYFSTNARSFKLSPLIEQKYTVIDITPTTIDLDFKRNPRIHKCYLLRH